MWIVEVCVRALSLSLSLSRKYFWIFNNKTRLRLYKMNLQSFKSAETTGNSKLVYWENRLRLVGPSMSLQLLCSGSLPVLCYLIWELICRLSCVLSLEIISFTQGFHLKVIIVVLGWVVRMLVKNISVQIVFWVTRDGVFKDWIALTLLFWQIFVSKEKSLLIPRRQFKSNRVRLKCAYRLFMQQPSPRAVSRISEGSSERNIVIIFCGHK